MENLLQSIRFAGRRQRREVAASSALCSFPLSFGRYRDVALAQIPRSYLRWMLQADNVPDADRWAAEQFLRAVAGPRRRHVG